MDKNYGLEKTEQQFTQISKDIAYLSELINDPKKYSKLIKILDPTVDKLNACFIELQDKLTEKFNQKIKEFETTVTQLNDLPTFIKSKSPDFLSEADQAKWQKLATSNASKKQLADFKQSLVDSFKSGLSKMLKIDELAKQNLAIRQILERIRRTLLI